MTTIKSTIKTEAIYSDNKKHRFLIKRTWDTSLPSAAIIMLAPSDIANEIATDMTGMYVLNNCYKLSFGSVAIMNIFSHLSKDTVETCLENDTMLTKVCKEADTVILAYGTGCHTKPITQRIQEVHKLLHPFAAKIVQIADEKGFGYHPLARTVRHQWQLVALASQ